MAGNKKNSAAVDGKVKLKALVPIAHNGDDYNVGDELEVTTKQADQLLAVEAAEEVGAVEAPAA